MRGGNREGVHGEDGGGWTEARRRRKGKEIMGDGDRWNVEENMGMEEIKVRLGGEGGSFRLR